MKKIYLAIPYTHEDEAVREFRFELANKITAKLINEGNIVYSPISSSHPLVKYGLPGHWDYWKEFDEFFIGVCDELHVVKASGWWKSTGVQAEIKIAEALGKPIHWIDVLEGDMVGV